MIFAITLLPIMAFVGASVDLSRQWQAEQDLQHALDSAVLHAANLLGNTNPKTIIPDVVAANLKGAHIGSDELIINVSETQEAFSRTISANASGTIGTSLLGVIGINKLRIQTSASATQSTKYAEISLVLDISSSMEGAQLTNMKIAASDFVDRLFDLGAPGRTSFNLIPFGGSVNISHLFDDYAEPLASAIVDPNEAEYDLSNVATAGYRFTDSNNCIEYTEDDYDLDEIPAESRSQVPHFWTFRNFHPWCPIDQNAAIFNSSDANALTDAINNLTLSDGTGTNIGALWGLKSLSPELRGELGGDSNFRPRNFDTNSVTKIMVLMADGGITLQRRPLNPDINNIHTNAPADNDPTLIQKDNISGNRNNEGDITTEAEATDRLNEMCQLARDNDILVYTIAFQVSSQADRDLLESCATNPNFFYDVNGLELEAAFSGIASSIGSLSLTQ